MKFAKHFLKPVCIFMISAGCATTGNPLFDSMDKNRDSKIEFEEFAEDMKQYAFDQLDDDDNRNISKEEWNSIDNVSDHEKL